MANDPLVEMLKSLSLDSGSVTVPAEPGTALLVDSTKSWPKDSRKNCIVRIVQGSGRGQQALIVSNSGQSLQVKPIWLVSLDTTSVYIIYRPEINAELLAILDLVQNPVIGLAALKVLLAALEGKLDDGTTGLVALKLLIDAIEAKLDDGTTGLVALKLLIDAIEAKLDDGTTGLVALKLLIDAIEAKLDLATAGGTFSYLDAGGEQTVFTFTPTKDTILYTIWLDLATLTQNSTIRLKHQIDGATYRTFETFNWTTGMDDGVYFRNIAVMAGRPIQVTMQETADEGADRSIPYYYVCEERA